MNLSTFCWFFLAFAGLAWISAEASVVDHSNLVDSLSEKGKNASVLLVCSLYIAHQLPLLALGEELVSRGHRVAVIGPVIEGVSTLPDIPLSKGMEFYHGGDISEEYHRTAMSGLKNVTSLFMFLYNMSKTLMESPHENYLIPLRKAVDKLNSSEWDFIVADYIAVTILHYIMKEWDTDRVMMNFSPLPILPAFAPPWTFPCGLSGFPENMNFKERFITALRVPVEAVAIWIFLSSSLFIPEEKQKTDPAVIASMGHAYPVLINTVIGFDYPKTITPLAHFMGPLLNSNPTPLSADLHQWLEKCKERSVIYISMGTTAELTGYLAREIIEGIPNQYRIVWSLRKSNQGILADLSIDPERVFVSGWIPQLALLQHPAVAMSVMHCGTSSVQESLYYGKPVICIPYGADQFDIAVRVKTQNYGITIFAEELTREKTMDAIGAIEEGPYYVNAQKLAKIFRMAGGTKKAADLVEFYAEVGQAHRVPAFIKYNWSWVQYYNVDVKILIIILLMVGGWVILKFLKCCCKCCSCWKKKTKKVKEN